MTLLRRNSRWLPRLGPRIVKSGLAVALAWWMGQALIGHPRPIFASLAALNAVQPTISASITRTAGLLVGMFAGSVLAVLTAQFLPAAQAVAAGVTALLALGLTRVLRQDVFVTTEVVTSALLVFALSDGSPEWAAGRLWEAALGGLLGTVLNALFLPPAYLQGAESLATVLTLAGDLSYLTRQALADVLEPPGRDSARLRLLEVRQARRRATRHLAEAQRAREALRFNVVLKYSPLRRGAAARTERLARAIEALALGFNHTRTIARHTWQTARRGESTSVAPAVATRWSDLADALTLAIDHATTYALTGNQAALDAATRAIEAAGARVQENRAAEGPGRQAIDRLAALAEVDHILDDLAVALKLRAEPGYRLEGSDWTAEI